jgi:hypothetical protein
MDVLGCRLPRPILPWVQLAQDHTANVVATGLSAGFVR